MGYSRKTSNYLEKIALSDPTHMMSMADLVSISVADLVGYIVGDLWRKSSLNLSI